jgi:hypothetical protein
MGGYPPQGTAVVEEQYEPSERKTLDTSTDENSYILQTKKPKAILIMAYDADHYVELNQPVDGDSTLIKADGSLTITGKGVSKIYTKTTTGTGKLHIRVWR